MNLLIPMSDQDKIFSLPNQYNIKQTSDENKEEYQRVWIISWFNTKFSEQTSKELYGRQSWELLMR